MTIARFRETVLDFGMRHGRQGLPWRRASASPYHILVSEVMLQQTQVDRVIPYYRTFIRQFPTARALAGAPLRDVLIAWQGLGYNRRAKMLHQAAQHIVKDHGGRMPKEVQVLETLPGVGAYTARAVAAFAYNEDVVFIETNIRTAVIHHFFPNAKKVHDAEIQAVLTKALPHGRGKEWYAALMDYGTHLKRCGVRVNSRSSGYIKQKAFLGSEREARGAILKALVERPRNSSSLTMLLGESRRPQLKRALSALRAEGMVVAQKGRYPLPDGNP